MLSSQADLAVLSQGHTRMEESDNVHEIRAYRRGFQLARGKFLVMLQVRIHACWRVRCTDSLLQLHGLTLVR